MSSVVEEEIQLLKEIYVHEMTVKHISGQCYIRVLLHPATAEDAEKQFVCLTLEICVNNQYPDTVPCISISKPRGLGEDHLSELRQKLHSLAEQKRGEVMLFDIVELTKESLTESNRPHGICAVCQQNFDEKEDFIRTDCYHYFHSPCFHSYIQHELDTQAQDVENVQYAYHVEKKEKQIVCPVCRVPITFDTKKVSAYEPVQNEDTTFIPDARMRQWQEQTKALLAKQRAKGGLIDLEEERTKYLLPSNP